MPEGGSPQYSSITSISVYMDTCVLSRIVDVRLKETTALAYAEIVERGGVQLVTSHKTRTEVLATANPVRKSLLQFLVALVQKVPLRTLHLSGAIGGAPVGAVPIGGSRKITDEELIALSSQGLSFVRIARLKGMGKVSIWKRLARLKARGIPILSPQHE